MSYVLLLAFFACLVVFLVMGARYEYSRIQLENARANLAALQNVNMILSDEIYANLDMDAIEHFAVTYLGMGVPEEFQLMEIPVRPQSFFVSGGEAAAPPRVGSFSDFWSSIFNFGGDR